MSVASSRFHRPYVHFTYIDMRGALTLAHKNCVVGNAQVQSARARLSRPLNYAYENARLLFEGDSYFFELAKSAATIRAATIRGAATIQVHTVNICTNSSYSVLVNTG